MKINVKNLPRSYEELQKIIQHQQAEIASYKEKYARLLEEIRLAKQHRFASSSEKNPVAENHYLHICHENKLYMTYQMIRNNASAAASLYVLVKK